MKKRIAILISTTKTSREYFELFPFEQLAANYDLDLLTTNDNFDSAYKFTVLKISSLSKRLNALIHYSQIWFRKETNLSYKLRAISYFGTKKDKLEFSSFQNFQYAKQNFFKRVIVLIFGTSIGIKSLIHLQKSFFYFDGLKNKKLKNYNLIILPYGGGIDVNFDFVIWYSKRNCIMTLAVQENWDNLSSKSFLLFKPDSFLTWGKQSSSHLRTMQNFRGSICEIGSLRLEKFYRIRREREFFEYGAKSDSDKSSSNFLRILVIGTGNGIHDLKTIEYLKKLQIKPHHLNIVYRPHPFSGISLNIFARISALINTTVSLPPGDEKTEVRISQILESDFIISLYSTVLLEASILNKKCIIPSFLLPDFSVSGANYIDDSSHYMGMFLLNNVYNVRTEKNFTDILKIESGNLVYERNDSKILNWFCSDYNTSQKILDYILKLPFNLEVNS